MSDVVMVSQAAWGAIGVVSAASVTTLGVVLVGWLNSRNRPPAPIPPQDTAELERLRRQLKTCRQRRRVAEARIVVLEARVALLDPGGPPP